MSEQVTTEWAVRRDDNGELTTTDRVGLYAPEYPHNEESTARWCKHVRGYTAVSRVRTVTLTEWTPAALAPRVVRGDSGEGSGE